MELWRVWKPAEADPELQIPNTGQRGRRSHSQCRSNRVGNWHLPESASLSVPIKRDPKNPGPLLQGAGIKATGFQSQHIQRDWINGSVLCPRLWSTEITDLGLQITSVRLWPAGVSFFSICISIFSSVKRDH